MSTELIVSQKTSDNNSDSTKNIALASSITTREPSSRVISGANTEVPKLVISTCSSGDSVEFINTTNNSNTKKDQQVSESSEKGY